MKITYEDVVAKVTEIVNEKGRDYIYNEKDESGDCYYFEDGTPSCVVGHWIRSLGDAQFESIVKCKEATSAFPADELREIAAGVDISMDIEAHALAFLRVIQFKQDAGATWGQALDYAINQIESGNI